MKENVASKFYSETSKNNRVVPFFNEGRGTQETITTEVGADATLL